MMYVVVELIGKDIKERKMSGLKIDPNGSVFLAFLLLPQKQLKVLTFYMTAKLHMHAFVSIDLASTAYNLCHTL